MRHSFSVIGSNPQHLKFEGETTKLIIGNDNVLEHVTIKPGTNVGTKKINGNNGFYGWSHVAHDCLVGNNVMFINNAVIGGVEISVTNMLGSQSTLSIL